MGGNDVNEAILAFGDHEHRDLARGLDTIHDVGSTISPASRSEALHGMHDVLGWIVGTLQTHVAWEESWLFPEIDRRAGTPWATRSARFDHRQIHALVTGLRDDEATLAHPISPATANEIRARLLAFEALVRQHIDREERLLLPVLLDTDTPVHVAPGARA